MTYIKKNLHFFNLKKNALRTDQPTDGPTDGRTDSTCNPTDHVPVFRASSRFTFSLYRISPSFEDHSQIFSLDPSKSRVEKSLFFSSFFTKSQAKLSSLFINLVCEPESRVGEKIRWISYAFILFIRRLIHCLYD